MTVPPGPLERPHGEAGFAITELLISITIGLVVMLAAASLLDRTLVLSARTGQRVDSNARGRQAMDLITRELRNQICLTETVTPLVDASATQVTYYIDFKQNGSLLEKHRMLLVGGDLVQQEFVGTGTAPNITWPGTPTRTRTLLENVGTTGPLFRYYAWGTGTPVIPNVELTAPLNSTDLPKPVRIEINFTARPPVSAKSNAGSSTFHDSVFVREGDTTSPGGGPRCA